MRRKRLHGYIMRLLNPAYRLISLAKPLVAPPFSGGTSG
jgi:hypothetical protein